jgi:Zn-finger nucleic acid-binding protein
MSELTCPKCQSPMRSYERNGVTVDQCSGCRGVFLDRGELERLVDAESAYYEARGATPEPPPQQQPQYREPTRQEKRGSDLEDLAGKLLGGAKHSGGYGHGHHGKRRKKSFLDELFD